MARQSRERFLAPPVTRAMRSPSAVVLAGAGAGVVLLTGLPAALAPVAAAAGWAVRVAVALPHRRAPVRIDPFTLAEPWRLFVRDAQQAAARFDRVVATAEDGPLRDRLEQIGDRIGDGVESCWRVARRGQQLVEARRLIDTSSVRDRLEALEALEAGGETDDDDHDRDPVLGAGLEGDGEPGGEGAAAALRSQLEVAHRMDTVIAETRDRLRLLDARLGESVARSVELSVRAGDAEELTPLGADVDGVVNELEALRQALEETRGIPSSGAPDGT